MSDPRHAYLSFLDAEWPVLLRRRQRVNLYEILGQTDSELAADRTLAFFLDPAERHGMGTAMVDALLESLNNHFAVGVDGRTDRLVDTTPFLGHPGWLIDRQVPAQSLEDPLSSLGWSGFIDLYLTNRELDLAIVIENKIWAAINNPLESYVHHAINDRFGTVILTLLAPRDLTFDDDQRRWTSGAITYATLLKAHRERLNDDGGVSATDAARSTTILEQFQEIRERSDVVTDYPSEERFIDQFRRAIADKADSLAAFYESQQQMNRLFRDRSQRIGPLVNERLASAGIATIWEAHGASTTGHWTYAWNAYQLERSGNSIELILDASPFQSAAIGVKAYPGRDYKYFPGLQHAPIDRDWTSSDAEIADAFIEKLLEIEEQYSGSANQPRSSQ